jgi:hypothetical protein
MAENVPEHQSWADCEFSRGIVSRLAQAGDQTERLHVYTEAGVNLPSGHQVSEIHHSGRLRGVRQTTKVDH